MDIAVEVFIVAMPIIMGTAIISVTNIIDMKMVTQGLIRAGEFNEVERDVLYGRLTGKFGVLTTMPVSISAALAVAIIPNIASSFKVNNIDSVKKQINTAMKYVMIVAIPAAVGLTVLADPILKLLFPKQSNGADLLQIGSISIIFLSLSQISTGILQGINRLYVPVIAAFVGGLVKIPLNYFLIQNPKINVVGAVISTTACYIVAAAISLYYIKKTINVKFEYKNSFLSPLLCSIIMGMSCYVFYHTIYFLIPNNSLSTIVSIILSGYIYFVFMRITGAITKKDMMSMPIVKRFVK